LPRIPKEQVGTKKKATESTEGAEVSENTEFLASLCVLGKRCYESKLSTQTPASPTRTLLNALFVKPAERQQRREERKKSNTLGHPVE